MLLTSFLSWDKNTNSKSLQISAALISISFNVPLTKEPPAMPIIFEFSGMFNPKISNAFFLSIFTGSRAGMPTYLKLLIPSRKELMILFYLKNFRILIEEKKLRNYLIYLMKQKKLRD